MAGANEGIYDWQAMRDEIFISDRFKTLIQIPRFIFTLTPADWLKRIHPQDKAQYRRAIRAHFQGETECFHL
jgi:hypothetical protein